MKSKIGIITFHQAKNYGAVLQAYALSTTLNKNGFSNEIIDYQSAHLKDTYSLFGSSKEKWGLKKVIKLLLTFKSKMVKSAKFDNFLNEHISLSNDSYDLNEMKKNMNNKYSAVIVGSDQVWNWNLNGDDSIYYLSFINNSKMKKISYAASFGFSTLPQQYFDKTKKYLEEFHHIAVREDEAHKIIKKLSIDKKVEVVLDPTLLLSATEWEEKFSLSKKNNPKKYVFVYIVAGTPNILNVAKKVADERGLEVICLHSSVFNKKGVNNVKDVSPIDFLELIRNAEVVLTSSYHGLCFSIIFQKEFYYELDDKSENNNSRLLTLERIFKLRDQRIENNSINNVYPNYDYIHSILEQKKRESITYLLTSID